MNLSDCGKLLLAIRKSRAGEMTLRPDARPVFTISGEDRSVGNRPLSAAPVA